MTLIQFIGVFLVILFPFFITIIIFKDNNCKKKYLALRITVCYIAKTVGRVFKYEKSRVSRKTDIIKHSNCNGLATRIRRLSSAG